MEPPSDENDEATYRAMLWGMKFDYIQHTIVWDRDKERVEEKTELRLVDGNTVTVTWDNPNPAYMRHRGGLLRIITETVANNHDLVFRRAS